MERLEKFEEAKKVNEGVDGLKEKLRKLFRNHKQLVSDSFVRFEPDVEPDQVVTVRDFMQMNRDGDTMAIQQVLGGLKEEGVIEDITKMSDVLGIVFDQKNVLEEARNKLPGIMKKGQSASGDGKYDQGIIFSGDLKVNNVQDMEDGPAKELVQSLYEAAIVTPDTKLSDIPGIVGLEEEG